MKTACPHCGFEGNIRDELIPDRGRTVGCPKCKTTFLVTKETAGDVVGRTVAPKREADDYGQEFILSDRRRGGTQKRKGSAGPSVAILSFSFVMVFVVGLLVGRATRDWSFTTPLKRTAPPPLALKTPVSSSPAEVESSAPPPTESVAPPPSGGDVTAPPPSEPLILEESFTSDVYLDIGEVDGKVNEETLATGLKRDLMLKEYGESLVGKNLVGYFIVRDVGKLSASFSKLLPLSLYSYYIEAEDESDDPVKSVVYLGLKQADDLALSLDRGTKVYIKGFIYGCTLAGDRFDLGLVNGEVQER
jgi:predicted Zn finger-like uncharacterized protein